MPTATAPDLNSRIRIIDGDDVTECTWIEFCGNNEGLDLDGIAESLDEDGGCEIPGHCGVVWIEVVS